MCQVVESVVSVMNIKARDAWCICQTCFFAFSVPDCVCHYTSGVLQRSPKGNVGSKEPILILNNVHCLEHCKPLFVLILLAQKRANHSPRMFTANFFLDFIK